MNRSSWRWLPFVSAAVLVPACMGSSGETTSSSSSSSASSSASSSSSSSSSSGGALPSDAMCDVLELLQERCWSCHGTTLHDKAPSSLVTLDQLKSPSPVDASHSNAEQSVLRMEGTVLPPMPPGDAPSVPAETIALFKAWIAAGYPQASCGDGAKDPYAAAAKCSGKQLGLNQQEGEDMNPGRACNTCHEQVNSEQGGDAPIFTLAGTVFATAHEPDDCRANLAEGASVEITDSLGKVITVKANEAGNFFYEEADLKFPYTAKVLFGGRERAMARPQTNGVCNECHSQEGSQEAPGRILLP